MRSIPEIDRDHEGMGDACEHHSHGCAYPTCQCDRSKRIVPNVRGIGGIPDSSYADCHGYSSEEARIAGSKGALARKAKHDARKAG